MIDARRSITSLPGKRVGWPTIFAALAAGLVSLASAIVDAQPWAPWTPREYQFSLLDVFDSVWKKNHPSSGSGGSATDSAPASVARPVVNAAAKESAKRAQQAVLVARGRGWMGTAEQVLPATLGVLRAGEQLEQKARPQSSGQSGLALVVAARRGAVEAPHEAALTAVLGATLPRDRRGGEGWTQEDREALLRSRLRGAVATLLGGGATVEEAFAGAPLEALGRLLTADGGSERLARAITAQVERQPQLATNLEGPTAEHERRRGDATVLPETMRHAIAKALEECGLDATHARTLAVRTSPTLVGILSGHPPAGAADQLEAVAERVFGGRAARVAAVVSERARLGLLPGGVLPAGGYGLVRLALRSPNAPRLMAALLSDVVGNRPSRRRPGHS